MKTGAEILREGDLQIEQQPRVEPRLLLKDRGLERKNSDLDYSPGGRKLLVGSARFKHRIRDFQTTYCFTISSLSGQSVPCIGQPCPSQQEK